MADESNRNNTPEQWSALAAQWAELPQQLSKLQEAFRLRAREFAELQQLFDLLRRCRFNPNFLGLSLPSRVKLPSLDSLSKGGSTVRPLAGRHAPAKPAVRQKAGKEWVADHAGEFDPHVTGITEAGKELSEKSKSAPDCAKPLKPRYAEQILRGLGTWPKAFRGSSKQRLK